MMRKLFIILTLIGVCNMKLLHAQSLIVSAKGGFAYASGSIDSEVGFMGTVSIENKFCKYLSLGINGKFGGTEYADSKTTWENNVLIAERELNISNTAYALNIFSKISFVTSDDIILSLLPEVGYYWMESDPTIYFIDKLKADVTYNNYDSRIVKNVSYGLQLEGQYYLTDKLNALVSIGWNNYNIGTSLNKIDLGGDWNPNLNEKTFYLYFEAGITYLLFGKDIWE